MIHHKRVHPLRAAFSILASFSAISLFFSCGQNKASYMDFADCGLSLPIDGTLAEKGLGIQTFGAGEGEYPSLFAFFQYAPALDALNRELEAAGDGMTEELFDRFMTQAMQHYKRLAVVYAVPAPEYDAFVAGGQADDGPFVGMKKLGSRQNLVYLARYEYEDNSTEGMDEIEKGLYEECVRGIGRALQKAKFIDLASPAGVRPSMGLPPAVPDFQTVDLSGATVSRELFSRADVTVVNVWGTFCGPCIQEMPELAAWDAILPDGVQLVGLVCDVNSPDDADGLAAARDIVGKAGISFTNILAGDDLQGFLANIQFVPTTFLVDRNGSIIGEPIIGADVDKYRKAVSDYLSQN